MINHDDVFRQLTDAGLLVDRLEVDAKMHRCRVDGMDRENRGWYCLHEWRGGDGNLYIVGSYGIWQGNDQGATKVKLKGVTLSDAEKAAMRARMAEDRKRAVADRARVADLWWRGTKESVAKAMRDYAMDTIGAQAAMAKKEEAQMQLQGLAAQDMQLQAEQAQDDKFQQDITLQAMDNDSKEGLAVLREASKNLAPQKGATTATVPA